MKKSNIKILLTGLVVVLTLTSKAQWEGPKYGEDSIACITNISLYRSLSITELCRSLRILEENKRKLSDVNKKHFYQWSYYS